MHSLLVAGLALASICSVNSYGPPPTKNKHRTTTTTTESPLPDTVGNSIYGTGIEQPTGCGGPATGCGGTQSPYPGGSSYTPGGPFNPGTSSGGSTYWWQGPNSPFTGDKSPAVFQGQPQQPGSPQSGQPLHPDSPQGTKPQHPSAPQTGQPQHPGSPQNGLVQNPPAGYPGSPSSPSDGSHPPVAATGSQTIDISKNPFLSSALGQPNGGCGSGPSSICGGKPQYPGGSEGQSQHPGQIQGQPQNQGLGQGQPQFPGAGQNTPQYPGAGQSQPQYPGSISGKPQYPGAGQSQPQYPGTSQGQPEQGQPQYPGSPGQFQQPHYGQNPQYGSGANSIPSGKFPPPFPGPATEKACNTPNHLCVSKSACNQGVLIKNGVPGRAGICNAATEVCCKIPTSPSQGSQSLPNVGYGNGYKPGTNGIPIGGSIHDIKPDASGYPTPSTPVHPYSGPLNTTPHPGCAAALKCVPISFCTAEGVMSNTPVILTKEQEDNRVPMTDCLNEETKTVGKCCRDPNYKDPWPGGMMMNNPTPGGYDNGQYHPEQVASNSFSHEAGIYYNVISTTPKGHTINKPIGNFNQKPTPFPTKPPAPSGSTRQPAPVYETLPERGDVGGGVNIPSNEILPPQPGQTTPHESDKNDQPSAPGLGQGYPPLSPNYSNHAGTNGLITSPNSGFPNGQSTAPIQPHLSTTGQATPANQPSESIPGKLGTPAPGYQTGQPNPSTPGTPTSQYQPNQPSFGQPGIANPGYQPGQTIPGQPETPVIGYQPNQSSYGPAKPGYEPGQPTPSHPGNSAPQYHPGQSTYGQPGVQKPEYQSGQTSPGVLASGNQPIPGQNKIPGSPASGYQTGPPSFGHVVPSTPEYQTGQPLPGKTSLFQQQSGNPTSEIPVPGGPRPGYQPGQPTPGQPGYQTIPDQQGEVTPGYQTNQPGISATPTSGYHGGQYRPGQPGASKPGYQSIGQPDQLTPGYQPHSQNKPGQQTFGQYTPSISTPNSFQNAQENIQNPTVTPLIPRGHQAGQPNPGFPAGQVAPGSSCGIRHQAYSSNSEDAGETEFPWQALVISAGSKKLLCGAAIISQNAVVTAAHCVENFRSKDLIIKVGVWKILSPNDNEQIRPVTAIARHPKYDSGSLAEDLAILIVLPAFTFTEHVDKICLPKSNGYRPSSNTCVVTGWGRQALKGPIPNSILHKVSIFFMENAKCEETLRATHLGKYFILNKEFSCALPKSSSDLCKVDVGGPLACDRGDGHYELSGVNSWDVGCPAEKTPTVFSNPDAEWIEKIIDTPTNKLQEDEERYNADKLKGESLDQVDIDQKPGFSQGYGK